MRAVISFLVSLEVPAEDEPFVDATEEEAPAVEAAAEEAPVVQITFISTG